MDKKTCHIFYTWIGCIQGTLPILLSRHFIFTTDKHKYTSSYIYRTDFEIMFSWFILESSHIAAGPFESSFGPFIVLFTLHVYIKPSKMVYNSSSRFCKLSQSQMDPYFVFTYKRKFICLIQYISEMIFVYFI